MGTKTFWFFNILQNMFFRVPQKKDMYTYRFWMIWEKDEQIILSGLSL